MTEQERITELEIKITYLEDYLEKLNNVIIKQEKRINSLTRELKELKIEFNSAVEGQQIKEKPPHY